MRLSRKRPAGLETHIGRYRYHAPMDLSCRIDTETIAHQGHDSFTASLHGDMEWRTISDLNQRYPELVFARAFTKAQPRKSDGFDYVVGRTHGWTVARWKTVAEREGKQ